MKKLLNCCNKNDILTQIGGIGLGVMFGWGFFKKPENSKIGAIGKRFNPAGNDIEEKPKPITSDLKIKIPIPVSPYHSINIPVDITGFNMAIFNNILNLGTFATIGNIYSVLTWATYIYTGPLAIINIYRYVRSFIFRNGNINEIQRLERDGRDIIDGANANLNNLREEYNNTGKVNLSDEEKKRLDINESNANEKFKEFEEQNKKIKNDFDKQIEQLKDELEKIKNEKEKGKEEKEEGDKYISPLIDENILLNRPIQNELVINNIGQQQIKTVEEKKIEPVNLKVAKKLQENIELWARSEIENINNIINSDSSIARQKWNERINNNFTIEQNIEVPQIQEEGQYEGVRFNLEYLNISELENFLPRDDYLYMEEQINLLLEKLKSNINITNLYETVREVFLAKYASYMEEIEFILEKLFGKKEDYTEDFLYGDIDKKILYNLYLNISIIWKALKDKTEINISGISPNVPELYKNVNYVLSMIVKMPEGDLKEKLKDSYLKLVKSFYAIKELTIIFFEQIVVKKNN